MALLTKTTKLTQLYLKFPKNLCKSSYRFNTSVVATTKPMKNESRGLILENQPHREILHVRGEKASSFLQGLMTNDINCLLESTDNNSIYSMFLNKAGRILYDTIIYRTHDSTAFLIECDASISHELERHLLSYCIRREIEVNRLNTEYQVWVAFDATASENESVDNVSMKLFSLLNTKNFISSMDPRQSNLGLRILCPIESSFLDLSSNLTQIQQKDISDINIWPSSAENNYRIHRYKFGIAEGPNEMTPGKCFPLEANGDFLNGVSFNKGCYLGQELTARVHHTGVIRKRHMPLKLSVPYNTSSPTNIINDLEGNKVGTVLCSLNDRGLALVKVAQAVQAKGLLFDEHSCFIKTPKWWPEKYQLLDKEKNVETL